MPAELHHPHVRVDIAAGSFDHFARLVRRALDVPTALVTLVEQDRQWFPGAVGLGDPWALTRETPLAYSFCQHVVHDAEPLVVDDAREHIRLRANPAIVEMGVVAYAGHPITNAAGEVVGALAAIDTCSRRWSHDEMGALADLALACSGELASRELADEAMRREREALDLHERSRVALSLSNALVQASTTGEVALATEQVVREHLGAGKCGIWLRPSAGLADPDVLRFVPTATPWAAALEYVRIPLSTANPVGAALVEAHPLYYPTHAAQLLDFPAVTTSVSSGEARALLPLLAEGRAFGTLVVVWDEPLEFTEDLRSTLQMAAQAVAQAVRRAVYAEERSRSLLTFQKGLLPRLPEIPTLELAARYLPASEHDRIGGDWYDVFPLPSGDVAVVIGDVAGHNTASAATMVQVRTMMRSLSWGVEDTPAGNVGRLDRFLLDVGEEGVATMVSAHLSSEADDEGRHLLRWTNAGHPPPLLLEEDGRVRWLEDADFSHTDVMVGVDPHVTRSDHVALVPRGGTVLLFTDGLTERRGEDLTEGLDRLAAAAAAHHRLPLELFVDSLLEVMAPGDLDDDVALLALRFRDAGAA
ncbi:SpoIIE family protein phosphatase [Nocardioides marmoribigeumensis]|uniref:Serine phosphatase RsbU (Regulator of sigma subunit) n=1 Tax=Nocardioides marmoribigeumensis TaxID=433649 RepID=A0ABU2BUE1_9ACTN|nr:SpoIIE family protein phosphatase [Nocardioides marmoribigeumensis]MDR7362245.1 serine phosphatase RsbU (regulator of sigma subunit) [Nocardioides marmoribigeumensis]